VAGNYLQYVAINCCLDFFYKSKTLHTKYMWCLHSVRNFTAHTRLCTVTLAILLYFTPHFNPTACSPLNHTAKRVSTTHRIIFCSYYFMQYVVSIFHMIISSIRSKNIWDRAQYTSVFGLGLGDRMSGRISVVC
jgi:hypothetical protein